MLHEGDCLSVMDALPDCSVDAAVCDPPYELGFMGKSWDSTGIAFQPETWVAVLRVLKPGGHLLAFGGSRTFHRIACAIEDAGFEIRDTLSWMYGTGFPKSLDVSKAVDASDATAERRRRNLAFTEWMRSTGISAARINALTGTNMGGHYLTDGEQPAVATADLFSLLRSALPAVPDWVESLVRQRTVESENMKQRTVKRVRTDGAGNGSVVGLGSTPSMSTVFNETAPATDAARQWEGWGTALKPAWEPIILARKPLAGTVAANVQQWGTGALNIDGCRIGRNEWDGEANRCASCVEGAALQQKRGTRATKASTATNSAAPTQNGKDETHPGATAKTDTGCSVGPNLGAPADAQFAAFNSNTEPSGKPSTGRSPTGSSSTTSTKYGPTTASLTCSSCGAPTMLDTTQQAGAGRWPSNVVLDEEAAAALDAQTGTLTSGSRAAGVRKGMGFNGATGDGGPALKASSGGASRFFYVAKASRSERDAGCEALPTRSGGEATDREDGSAGTESPRAGAGRTGGARNIHPTVKPVELMRWLCRLVTPPGGVVLDPFSGSGSTGVAALREGFVFIGCEREPQYAEIATHRLRSARDRVSPPGWTA